jgi:hypothetical protein
VAENVRSVYQTQDDITVAKTSGGVRLCTFGSSQRG